MARCNSIPSAVLWGRFNGTPLHERICPCSQRVVETLDHLLFHCPLYNEARRKCPALQPHLNSLFEDFVILQSLLASTDPNTILQIATFILQIVASNLKRAPIP